jgi:hypothetical protein
VRAKRLHRLFIALGQFDGFSTFNLSNESTGRMGKSVRQNMSHGDALEGHDTVTWLLLCVMFGVLG